MNAGIASPRRSSGLRSPAELGIGVYGKVHSTNKAILQLCALRLRFAYFSAHQLQLLVRGESSEIERRLSHAGMLDHQVGIATSDARRDQGQGADSARQRGGFQMSLLCKSS